MGKESPSQEVSAPPRLLSSWKEIAALLGISVRTAQIYEKTRGLPVQRDGKRVAALESDLIEWRRRRLSEISWWANVFILQRISAILALAVLLLGAFVAWDKRHAWIKKAPAYAVWNGTTLTATASDGSTVWQRSFPFLVPGDPDTAGPRTPWLGDLDHDGRTETVSIYAHNQRESLGWDLYCFSSTGETLWQLAISKRVQSWTKEFSPPYVVRSFTIFPSPDHDSTLWTAAVLVHHTMSPSALLVVDSAGRLRGEYWQMGHMNVVRSADLNNDGVYELLAGGIRESDRQAVLLIFDPRNVHGTPPPPGPSSPVHLRGMPPGTEKTVVYFPRTPVNRRNEPFNFVETMDLVGNRLQVTVHETLAAQKGYLLYTLNRQLQAVDIAPSASFNSALMRLNAEQEMARELGPEGLNALKKQIRIVHP
ncbi:MAG: helix-turn-helix domain-containing protein [Acidobacteria bacterium]|nr:helix-turn-helix domain-containing protein [Acidobacteriota bacterium]